MNRHLRPLVACLNLVLLTGLILACSVDPPGEEDEISPASSPGSPEATETDQLPPATDATPIQAESPPAPLVESDQRTEESTLTPLHSPAGPTIDKWSLWVNGPHLRGANIYQRRVYPNLDGPEFSGSGPLGPPHTPEDFDELAALGVNYVNISHVADFSSH